MDVSPITVPKSLATVLNSAGDKSNVDFGYLVQTAQRESSLNPSAKAPSSSAVGLFQFLDSTWLEVMKEEGPRLGYQSYADAISRDSDGDYVVKDKALRAEILKLRENPQVAADMAAAFTEANGDYLRAKFGKTPSPGELYIAHFLGPQGAEKFFNAGLKDPDQVAAKVFPKQAKANPQIFYSNGHARTIREVYRALVAKHEGTSPVATTDPTFATQQLAATTPPADPGTLPSRFTPADMSFTALFATDPRTVPQPLLAIAEATASPLVSAATAASVAGPIASVESDVAAPALGFAPLPDPGPLLPIADAQSPIPLPAVAADPVMPPPMDLGIAPVVQAAIPAPAIGEPPPDNGIPKPRILMTPRPDTASSLFLTQVYGQGGS